MSSVVDPQYLEVVIKASKTDPFRQGVKVYLGRSQADVCPVAAVLAYMVLRGTEDGPFFKFADGRALTRERLVTAMRSALRAAGLEESWYASHSFRIGVATTAALCGFPESLIQTLGRWKSSAYMLYICTPRETLCKVTQSLVQ